MKLVPLGDRVVLKQLIAEETTKSGIVLPGQEKEKPQQAEVIAVGPGTEDVKMEVEVGDKIIFSKYSGTDVKMEEEEYVLMGFDAGSSQLKALESGEIDGLVVQNPFGMGYAAVVAAARTILEIGNEAEVDTGYIWVTKDNMENESIKNMLYE